MTQLGQDMGMKQLKKFDKSEECDHWIYDWKFIFTKD